MAYIVETENGELKSYFIKGIFNPCRWFKCVPQSEYDKSTKDFWSMQCLS